MPTIEKRGVAAMQRVQRQHWFGTTDLPGESTEHPALRIVPDVHAISTPLSTSGARHQLRYTGEWSLLHVPTGHAINAERRMPLEWLRRFARLLGV